METPMLYELLTIMPFLAIASCIALGIVTIFVCSNEVVPEAFGFVVHDRKKARRSAPGWMPGGAQAVAERPKARFPGAPPSRHRGLVI
jgi:hypothetical protein